MVLVDGPTRTVHLPRPDLEIPEPNQWLDVPRIVCLCGTTMSDVLDGPTGVGHVLIVIRAEIAGEVEPLVWCVPCFPHGRPSL